MFSNSRGWVHIKKVICAAHNPSIPPPVPGYPGITSRSSKGHHALATATVPPSFSAPRACLGRGEPRSHSCPPSERHSLALRRSGAHYRRLRTPQHRACLATHWNNTSKEKESVRGKTYHASSVQGPHASQMSYLSPARDQGYWKTLRPSAAAVCLQRHCLCVATCCAPQAPPPAKHWRGR